MVHQTSDHETLKEIGIVTNFDQIKSLKNIESKIGKK